MINDPARPSNSRRLSQDQLGRFLRPGQRVYWPGCAGHSLLFEQWLKADPGLAAGLEFCGVWIPGVNRFDPCALHSEARATSFFLSTDLRAAWERAAVDYLPLHYSEISNYLGQAGRFDVLMLHLAPPDESGICSLSVAADFTPAVLRAIRDGVTVLAHLNPNLPRTNGPGVALSRIDAWVEAPMPLLSLPDETPDQTLTEVARQVAMQVRDGDYLQFGLGRLQAAVLNELQGHRGLKIHSGMVSDGLLRLRDAGALAPESIQCPPVCTGVALGSERLYREMANHALVRFAPVSHTHAQTTLASLPSLLAINSAIEIDLLGQVNCESIGGRQISGVGGLVDFIRGARASPGGRAIIAATATAGQQRRSRIVPMLNRAVLGLARTDIDIVVTEYGAAALRQLGVDERAQALIAIAAPEQREELQAAWHTLRRTL